MSEDCIAKGAMPFWVACRATWDHGDILAQAAAEDRVWVCGPTTGRIHGHITTKAHIDAQGLGHEL